MPPPAEELTAGPFVGVALRTQPDRRLVTLVREGYEVAFEEIVRRYGKALGRYAAAIVGGRSEDVTQDAFSKALLALRRGDSEIELRPWLYRIVRNTALNDLRDSPPKTTALTETIAAARTAAEEVERQEETADLMERLRSLPEPQRAAIVMRELEGLSHDEIAAALGVSGGAARQAIFRARQALRGGLGMLVPLPLMKLLIDHGAEAAVGAGASGAAIAGSAASAGGLGAGGALKIGLATALVAGAVGTGVAVEQGRNQGGKEGEGAAVSTLPEAGGRSSSTPPPVISAGVAGAESRGRNEEEGRSGRGEPGDDRGGEGGSGRRHGDDGAESDDSRHGPGREGRGPGRGHAPKGEPPQDGTRGPGGGHGDGGPNGSGGRSGGGSSGGGRGPGGHSGPGGGSGPDEGSLDGSEGRGGSGSGGTGGGHSGPGDGSGAGGSGQEPPEAEPEAIPPIDSPEGPEGSGEDGTDRSGSEGS